MKTKNKQMLTLEALKEKYYGKKGTAKRDAFESGYKNFKTGILLQEACVRKGMTLEQLTTRVGTTKSCIFKIENDIREVRLSTLQRIAEEGFGGKLLLSIQL